ncbi:MAG TPA: helix-turn-helix domain-containing protein [Acidimicrobiia bacterium]|jgi:TetR/AcrR family acrAB operon transcriptional repressor
MAGRRSQAGTAGSRDRILDAAARTFATYGYRKATFEEIAAGAGVSRTLLYRHFDNKLDLLRAVRDRALGEWADVVERAAEQRSTARGELEAIVGESLRFASEHPIFRAFLSGDSRLALEGEQPSGRLSREAWREQTAEILEQGVSAGEFAADLDPRRAASVLCAMQLGLIEHMHDDGRAAVVIGPEHIATASRVLVGGVVCPLDALAEPAAIA